MQFCTSAETPAKCNLPPCLHYSVQAERIKGLGSFIFGNKTAEQKRFYRYIAKDIQRPLFAVYRKMLRVFDVSNHVGRWSRENEEKLLRSVQASRA